MYLSYDTQFLSITQLYQQTHSDRVAECSNINSALGRATSTARGLVMSYHVTCPRFEHVISAPGSFAYGWTHLETNLAIYNFTELSLPSSLEDAFLSWSLKDALKCRLLASHVRRSI